MKIIINADDCGMSEIVNKHIEVAINANKITSTTIMANMEDFEGALRLYKAYGSEVSFGWHINLTEGCPLIYSQLLLDKGYFIERDGRVELNGKAFWKKGITSDMKYEIKKELLAQYGKLIDNGIKVSHVDSHHHIHTSLPMLTIIPSLLKEIGVRKVRRMRNNVPSSLNRLPREIWALIYKLQNWEIEMTDVFCYFEDYATNKIFVDGKTMELECHPGHPKYEMEEEMLMKTEFNKDNKVSLINYNNF